MAGVFAGRLATANVNVFFIVLDYSLFLFLTSPPLVITLSLELQNR